ncbi:MAG: RICIN domain-containing protein [Chloroflexia bacterium]|nr:RICIN domain-containing protein [Chloroflexia bacterium]
MSSISLTLAVPSLSTTAIILTKSTATPPQTTYVTISNRATGLLIDGMYRTNNGENCGQWSNSGSTAQQWVIETVGSYVKIKNRQTGLYIDGMGRTANNSIAGQYSSSSSYNQQWQQVPSGSYIKFKNRSTGLYLDGLGKTTDGADLGQWKKVTATISNGW